MGEVEYDVRWRLADPNPFDEIVLNLKSRECTIERQHV